jgi:hypothetical protein
MPAQIKQSAARVARFMQPIVQPEAIFGKLHALVPHETCLRAGQAADGTAE